MCNMNLSIAPDLTTLFSDNNLAMYNNDEIKNKIHYLDNITNEDELKNDFKRIYELYNEDIPYIGICRNKTKILVSNRLVGDIKTNWYSMFHNIKEWYTK